MFPVRGVCLDIDPVHTVEHVEVIDVNGARECLQRGEHVRKRHAYHLYLVPVCIEKELWNIPLHACRHSCQFLPLGSVVQKRVRRPVQIFIAGIALGFENHGNTSGSTEARNHGRSTDVHLAFRIKRKGIPYHAHDLVYVGLLPFVPRLEDDCELAVRLARADTRTGTGHIQHILDIRLSHKEIHGPVRDGSRPFKGRSYRKFEFHGEIPLVLLRHETLRQSAAYKPDKHNRHPENGVCPAGMVETGPDHPAEEIVACGKSFVDFPEYYVLLLSLTGRFEEKRTHHRAEGQGDYRGNDHGYGNRHGKLSEQLAGNSRQEADRHEYGAKHE